MCSEEVKAAEQDRAQGPSTCPGPRSPAGRVCLAGGSVALSLWQHSPESREVKPHWDNGTLSAPENSCLLAEVLSGWEVGILG